MSIFSRIFGGKSRENAQMEKVREFASMMKRRFDAADTTRLNGKRWARATDRTLMDSLVSDLDVLRRRCRYEVNNNGWLAGMIRSFRTDMVGKSGPVLRLQTENEDYITAMERVWRDWSAIADYRGEWQLADMLSMGAGNLIDRGEWFWHLVGSNARASMLPSLRIQQIRADRVGSGVASSTDPYTELGVTRDADGRVVSYQVEEINVATGYPTGVRTIDAANMVHFFLPEEEDQTRGYPLVANVLDVIGQLRDYDADVMQASRMAAMLAVLLEANDSEADPITLDALAEGIELQRGMMSAIPPGYTAKQITPQQPQNMYQAFRDEKLAEIGRPVCMPLMILRMDSQKHSYSSAQFDGKGYDRQLGHVQGAIERRVLNRIFARVEREALLMGLIPMTPGDLRLSWVWPKRPHVDPGKEAKAASERISNGTSDVAHECAELGRDPEDVANQREKEGLPRGPTAKITGDNRQAQEAEEVSVDA